MQIFILSQNFCHFKMSESEESFDNKPSQLCDEMKEATETMVNLIQLPCNDKSFDDIKIFEELKPNIDFRHKINGGMSFIHMAIKNNCQKILVKLVSNDTKNIRLLEDNYKQNVFHYLGYKLYIIYIHWLSVYLL